MVAGLKHSDDKKIFMFEDEVLTSLGAVEMLAFSEGDHLLVPVGKKIRTKSGLRNLITTKTIMEI